MTNAIRAHVLDAFHKVEPAHRETLLAVRALIFEAASEDTRIGRIEETLRWGEPAYITVNKKTGSTLRLSMEKTSGMPALFFNCNTTLVEEFRQQFGEVLTYSKNRAVLLGGDWAQHTSYIKMCIAAALTYHLRGKRLTR